MQIPKSRLIEPLIIISLIIIIGLIFFSTKDLHLKFQNNTGEDIDSFIVAGTYVGKVKKDSTTEISFRKLMFDSGIPYNEISGVIKDKKILKSNYGFCASGRQMVYEGEFVFSIRLLDDKNGNPYLYLQTLY